jgi:hypothetical protein
MAGTLVNFSVQLFIDSPIAGLGILALLVIWAASKNASTRRFVGQFVARATRLRL